MTTEAEIIAEREFFTNGTKPGPSTALRKALADTVETFNRWLYLEDSGIICVTLASILANYFKSDPQWLMLVGASSGGKTELMNAAAGLPNVHLVSTLTEQGLLSGSPKREQNSASTGGLLRQVGDFGILLLKDFTSILTLHRDTRASVMSALREVFDGRWDRHVGVDGGRTLSWSGKLGLVAGCTAAIRASRRAFRDGRAVHLLSLARPGPRQAGGKGHRQRRARSTNARRAKRRRRASLRFSPA
jgi:hypothetical protein